MPIDRVKKFFSSKRPWLIILLLLLISSSLTISFLTRQDQCTQIVKDYPNLVKISKAELALHDGVKLPTIYIGYQCLVYDVTDGKESYYGEGKNYHYLVGKDSSEMLKVFGGSIIKEKYRVIGILEE